MSVFSKINFHYYFVIVYDLVVNLTFLRKNKQDTCVHNSSVPSYAMALCQIFDRKDRLPHFAGSLRLGDGGRRRLRGIRDVPFCLSSRSPKNAAHGGLAPVSRRAGNTACVRLHRSC